MAADRLSYLRSRFVCHGFFSLVYQKPATATTLDTNYQLTTSQKNGRLMLSLSRIFLSGPGPGTDGLHGNGGLKLLRLFGGRSTRSCRNSAGGQRNDERKDGVACGFMGVCRGAYAVCITLFSARVDRRGVTTIVCFGSKIVEKEMICPFCGSEKSIVIRTESLMQTARVRRCKGCNLPYPTTESVDPEVLEMARIMARRKRDGQTKAHA